MECEKQVIAVNSLKAWLLGIRPTSLGGALMTVFVGAGLAHGMSPATFSWTVAVLCGIFACFMQVSANLINDVVDYKRGLDKGDPERIDRIYANGLLTRKAMNVGIAVCLTLGSLVGLFILYLVREHLVWGGWELILIGAVVIVCTFLYSTLFAYHGLGDLAVLLCFGLIPVCGTFYILAYTLTWEALWVAIIAGCSIDTLLILNNYRDRDEDPVAGKYTSVAILGEPFGRYLYLFAGLVCIVLIVLLFINGRTTWMGMLYASVPYLVLHLHSWIKLNRIREGNALNALYYETPRNFSLLGILLTIALW
ncbi:MAG: 1,4-dihydroxy-2-naphthoate octaprenyltransferase [Bacteroidaceae bacterium]|nr:1,4-dihydroxy-2-naphthoate octaprenyltransferase [Bacteroidaceae bacterium]